MHQNLSNAMDRQQNLSTAMDRKQNLSTAMVKQQNLSLTRTMDGKQNLSTNNEQSISKNEERHQNISTVKDRLQNISTIKDRLSNLSNGTILQKQDSQVPKDLNLSSGQNSEHSLITSDQSPVMPCLSFRDLSERLLHPPAAPTLLYSDEKLINSEEEPCMVANVSLSSPTLHSDTILTDNEGEKEQKGTEISSDPNSKPSMINQCNNALLSPKSVSPSTILQSSNIEEVTRIVVESDELPDGMKGVSNTEVIMDEEKQFDSANKVSSKNLNIVEIVVEEMDTVKDPVDKTEKVTEKRSDTIEIGSHVVNCTDEPVKKS